MILYEETERRQYSRLSKLQIQLLVKYDTKVIPSKHFPLNKTFCSNLNFSIASFDEKLISLDTARHFKIFFGTRAAK